MKKTYFLITLFFLIITVCFNSAIAKEKSVIVSNEKAAHIAKQYLSKLTLEEKVDFISGMRVGNNRNDESYDGIKKNDRLNLPVFKIYHGPCGVKNDRYGKPNGTFFSASINMAMSWNPDLVYKCTNVIAKETRAAGGSSNAGPAMNIIRDLRTGRSFEYFTEDPYLNGKIAASYVEGVQDAGNFAIIKHFICNNQERNRNTLDVKVSQRALNEIYMPGFKMAIEEGGALGIMTGYNIVNGVKNPGKRNLIKDIVKDKWGFRGIVMTDWVGSDKNLVRMFNAGLDLEMPRPLTFKKDKVLKALKDGDIQESVLDDKVYRILYVLAKAGQFEKNPYSNFEINSKASHKLALQMAEESMVLLKNDSNLLPLNVSKIKNIAIVGPEGDYGKHYNNGSKSSYLYCGGGSGSVSVKAENMITPYKGIKDLVGKNVNVEFEPGCYADHGCTVISNRYFKTIDDKSGLSSTYYNCSDFTGKTMSKVDASINFSWTKTPQIIEEGNASLGGSKKPFSAKWEGKLDIEKSRLYTFEIQTEGLARLYIDGKLVVDKNAGSSRDHYAMNRCYLSNGYHSLKATFKTTTTKPSFRLLWDYGNDEYLQKAIELAKKSDVVIIPVGNSGSIEHEGGDRDAKLIADDPLSLSLAEVNLINEISKINKNIIVVTFSSGISCNDFEDNVPCIIQAGYPGQEVGHALANILFGKTNPSGRLSVTIPKSVKQYPEDHYTLTNNIDYKDGIYVGYRYFDKKKIEPDFAFGQGLSYTKFEYSKPVVKIGDEKLNVKLSISNVGDYDGKEVVQLYVGKKDSKIDRPLKELKAFKKIFIKKNESKDVSFELDKKSFSYFNEVKNDWDIEDGEYVLYIGGSSKCFKQKCVVKIRF